MSKILKSIILAVTILIIFLSCDLFQTETYQLTYDRNESTSGSVPIDDNEYEAGEPVTVLGNVGNLERTEYSFEGWNTEPDGSGVTYNEGQTFTMGVSDTVLYALWIEDEEFQVTYDGNSQTSGTPPIDNTEYQIGDTVTLMDNIWNLEKEGLRFGGWNTKSDGTGVRYHPDDTIPMPAGDITLYAMWLPPLSVTYHDNNATQGDVPVDTNEYLLDETVTVLGNTGNLEKTGYTFGGWNTKADGTGTTYSGGESLTIDSTDLSLYAVWFENLTVHYDGNGNTSGEVPVDSNVYFSGDSVTVLGNTGNLEKTNYNLIGWNTKADGTGISYSEGQTFDMPFSDITLFAEWEIKTYDVTFNSDGGDEVAPQEINHGATIDKPAMPTKQDYSFGGWFKEPELENPWSFDTDTVTVDITLYAKWDSIYPESFAGGSGTEVDPYQVETAGHLYIVRNHLDKHFIQTADIDLSTFSEGEGWAPIGAYYGDGYAGNAPFVGSFDGGGYFINNLEINRGDTNGIGLFGYIGENATISHINLGNIDLHGNKYVGGLVGYNDSGEIKNSSVSGLIEGEDSVGGLIGYNIHGNISDSHASGNVSGNIRTGGLIGSNSGDISYSSASGNVSGDYSLTGGLIGGNYGDISYSYTTGDVSGTRWTGGLIGSNSGDISYCSATGNVSCTYDSTGGLIGHNNGNIYDSFAQGDVTGTEKVGGLVGAFSGSSDIIKHSYSTGMVTGTMGVGGLIGSLKGSVDNSYYDKETSGLSVSAGGTPKTTEEMMQQATFENWDFTNVWAIDEGSSYPYLQWELD